MGWARTIFGAVAPSEGTHVPVLPPLPDYSSGEFHQGLNKEQIAIYAGGRLPGAASDEADDLQVAASVLSSRLYEDLRERQGLAYSTGAGAEFDRDFGWYYVSIATGAENYQTALDGLTVQTEKLALDGPREAEIRRAKNQIWGRLMSAKLSRINQAYYLALDDFLGREPGYDRILLDRLQKVSVQSVRRAAARHFRPSLWVIASAGRKP
jgi:zinc protease